MHCGGTSSVSCLGTASLAAPPQILGPKPTSPMPPYIIEGRLYSDEESGDFSRNISYQSLHRPGPATTTGQVGCISQSRSLSRWYGIGHTGSSPFLSQIGRVGEG